MKTTEQKVEQLSRMAIEVNVKLPTDVMLKGDGTFWITTHGNDGVRPRKATNQEILQYLFIAIDGYNRMISV